MSKHKKVYGFGGWRIELERGRNVFGCQDIEYTIFRGEAKFHLPPRLKKVFLILVDRANEPVKWHEIHDRVWDDDAKRPASRKHDVWTAVGELKKWLKEGQSPIIAPTIDTDPDGKGYCLSADVTIDGSLDLISGFGNWPTEYLEEKIMSIKRNDSFSEDIRIANVALTAHVAHLHLDELAEKGVRVRIIMTHPRAMGTLKARFMFRGDKTIKNWSQDIHTKLFDLNQLQRKYPRFIDFCVSDAMPPGALFHANEWVIFGIFPAHAASTNGPMIEGDSGSRVWKILYEDFRTRWNSPSKLKLPASESSHPKFPKFRYVPKKPRAKGAAGNGPSETSETGFSDNSNV